MARWLSHLDNTWSRIVLAFLILASVLMLTLGYLADQFKTTMLDFRHQELRRLTEVARATIEPVLQDYRAGRLSHAQALNAVRDLIRPMTYNDLFGPNYIFMSSYDGIMLVQPYEPALEGTNQANLTDDRGMRIVEILVTKAREGSGFVSYEYHPPNRFTPQRKVSYVMGITELDAYIGTGMYSEDMGNYFAPFLTRLYSVCILVFFLILLAQYLLLRPMFNSYRQLVSAFRQTGKSPECRRLLDVSPYRKGSEAESLISGFNAMIVDIQHTIAERKQVELQLQQAHMELTANHEELQASNEELSALYEQVASTNEALHMQYKELKASEAMLESSEERYRLALEGANDTIFDWDLRTNRLYWTARWSEALGLPANQLSGDLISLREWIHPDDRAGQDKALIAHLHGEAPYYGAEFRIRTQSGEYIWASARGKALFNEHGQPLRMAGSFTDITEKKQREKQIWNLAFKDVLTGLPNRALLTERLATELSQDGIGSLFFLDIDNFKLINDLCGHAQGDQLLAETASRLNAIVGPSATVARLGGDEFIILMPGISAFEDISVQAKRLLEILPENYIISGHHFRLTISIGIACYVRHGAKVEELLRNADTALYEVKNAGKNGWKIYDPSMHDDLVRKQSLERDLQKGLLNQQFELHLQPILNLSNAEIAGFEALLRWHSPNGMAQPLSFIPMAESTGLIIPLGRWVIRDACRIARLLRELGHPDLYIAVNISLRQLSQDDFVSIVSNLLAEAGLPPSALALEITETMLMESFETNILKLQQLKAMGVRLSLDDFGTGYSSLTYLRKLPVDTVKIDKSFVNNLSTQQCHLTMLSSIIDLARNLGLKVVAEGVETQEQRDFLNQCLCHYIQGYLISPPLPLQQALTLLPGKKQSKQENG